MADRAKAVRENEKGDFFVDLTCINCDTCRQLAPKTFADAGDHSYVKHQPSESQDIRAAARALLACPTASIGSEDKQILSSAIGDFPMLLEDEVFYLGFNSRKSYGGNAFLVVHPKGNWMIDSPRFVAHLAKRIEELGGLSRIFLTHQDDIADASKYAEHFGAERIIAEADSHAAPDSEVIVSFDSPQDTEVGQDFEIIPTPGHTEGHMVLLYKNKFLFTGDHLYFSRYKNRLNAHSRHCWYSWEEQIESMRKLIEYDFEWILAGHGDRVKLSIEETKVQLKALVLQMENE